MMSFNVQAALCFPLGEPLSVFSTSFDDSSPFLESPLGMLMGVVDACSPSSAPAFLVVMSYSEVYQGTWPGKAVVRWSEPWIWNLEAGIWNLEAGTRNPEYFEELLFWLLQLLEFIKVVNPAERCYALLEDLLSFSYVAEL
ncbi:hypothetical protein F2Q70_00004318 [Brassica cretica]|uniref:Uncharacterized protein n=1 Tax=Brassica cretica TaxID=69181 RepID=A0A8S9IZ40_BRACR|nr:hypothetical protein F2Q70_00004318 [Brassica cretica]